MYRSQSDSSFKLQIITEFESVKRNSDKNELASLKEYDDIFKGIGKVIDFEHKLSNDPSVKPVSQPLRCNCCSQQ